MSLGRTLLIVSARIEPSVEADWNRWYDETHLPEIVACPGFQTGQRYVATDASGGRRYIAVYELETQAALQSAEFSARRGWGPFVGKVQFETLVFERTGA